MTHSKTMSDSSAGEELRRLLAEAPESAARRSREAFDRATAGRAASLVLFGGGALGRRTLAGLRSVGIEPLAFCDNNPAAWATSIEGVPVLPPAEAVRRLGATAAFVVTIWRDVGGHPVAEIRNQLSTFGPVVVVSAALLFWKYPATFLPYFSLDLPERTLEAKDAVERGFSLWADEASRREYVAQIRWRLHLDFEHLTPRVPWPSYLPDDLFRPNPREVFVDCGAFDGDTLKDYVAARPDGFARYVALEPDPANHAKLLRYVATVPEGTRERITVIDSAVGAQVGTVRFSGGGTAQSSFSSDGSLEVKLTTLDALSAQCVPTYVKMDIEGAEEEALRGGAATLREHRPILAICVYHQYDHLWRLPLLMQSLVPEYSFHLRPHRDAGWDLVCYAIPRHRALSPLSS